MRVQRMSDFPDQKYGILGIANNSNTYLQHVTYASKIVEVCVRTM